MEGWGGRAMGKRGDASLRTACGRGYPPAASQAGQQGRLGDDVAAGRGHFISLRGPRRAAQSRAFRWGYIPLRRQGQPFLPACRFFLDSAHRAWSDQGKSC